MNRLRADARPALGDEQGFGKEEKLRIRLLLQYWANAAISG